MKIIKPQALAFTSNIPEPDAARGEAVYQDSESTTYPFSVAGDAESVAYISTDTSNKNYRVETTGSALNRSITSASKSFAITTIETPQSGYTSKFGSNSPDNITNSAQYQGVVLATSTDASDSIFRSADGGLTWVEVPVGMPDSHTPNTVVFDSLGNAFCAYSEEVMISTDLGLSWSLSNDEYAVMNSSSRLVYDGYYVTLISRSSTKRYDGTWILSENVISQDAQISCANNGYTYIVDFFGDLYESSNGGLSFSLIRSGISGSQLTAMLNINRDVYYFNTSSSYLISRTHPNYNSTSENIGLTGIAHSMLSVGGDIFSADNNGFLAVKYSAGGSSRLDYLPSAYSNIVYCGDYLLISIGANSHALSLTNARITSDYSLSDGSTKNTVLVSNFTAGSSEFASVVRYGSSYYVSPQLAESIELKSSQFTSPTFGQCCSDGRFTYQIIKDSGNWFIYKIDTIAKTAASLDLGAANSGYIDNFNSLNPAIFIDSNGLNIPINKALTAGKFDTVLRVSLGLVIGAEIVPNALLSSNARSVVNTGVDTTTWILSNDTVEVTDATDYDSLGGYREGDEVISLSTHKRYRATTNTLDTPEAGSQKTPPSWTEIAPTNKYAFENIYIHNRTIATSESSSIDITFTLDGNQDSICFFGLENATEVTISSDSYSENLSLIDTVWLEKTGEIKSFESFVVTGEFLGDQTLSISIEGEGGLTSVGRIIVGRAVELGVTQYGAALTIEDFSKRERDEFGNFEIIPRDTAKNINFDVKINKTDVNFVFSYLSDLTTIPCVFLGDDDDAALQVYGFYSDYTHNVDYPSITSATISVEGLT